MNLIFILTFGIFIAVFLLFSVGVLFSNRCVRGSCGGVMVRDSSGEPLNCATCPSRKKESQDSQNKETHKSNVTQEEEYEASSETRTRNRSRSLDPIEDL